MLTLLIVGIAVFLIARWLWPSIKPNELRKPDIKNYSDKNEFSEEYGKDFDLQENELPESYGENYLSLMARDPHWIYAHWEISPPKLEEIISDYGYSDALVNSRPVVRVYDITDTNFDGTNAKSHFDYDTNEDTHNLHISVPGLGRTYCVELGRKMPDGTFLSVLRSNPIETPRLNPAYKTDNDWQHIEGIYQGTNYYSGVSSTMMTGKHQVTNHDNFGSHKPVKH